MADQLRWWKLWTSALDDPDLANLSMEDCWRWAALGALLRLHGEDGTATWRRPGHALAKAWRTTWPRLPQIARRLPNVTVQADTDSITLTMRNWRKYQEDSSVQRTRTWRERRRQRDGQQTVTGDGQPLSHVTVQTRRDGTPIIPSSQHRDQQPRMSDEQQRRHAELAARLARPIAGDDAPREAWRYDCPDRRYHGRCVDRAWAAAHPDVSMPVVPDDHGGYRPRECPHHRDHPTSP